MKLNGDLESSPLHQEWMTRLAEGRDMRCIVSADNSATGVGKTTLAVYLAKLWDIHGWTADKATLDPREFSVMYDEVPGGSVVILDEAEQAVDRRRSMSKETLAVGHDFATKRYRQVFGLLTLPSKDMMDARIADKLCDYWILVREKGEAMVFRLDENQFTGKVYYNPVETLRWPPMDDDRDFQKVEKKKVDRMTGKTQSRYVHRDEFEEMKENFWNKATQKTRYELIKAMNRHPDLTQTDVAEICGLHQSRVSQLVNTDSFEEAYDSSTGTVSG